MFSKIKQLHTPTHTHINNKTIQHSFSEKKNPTFFVLVIFQIKQNVIRIFDYFNSTEYKLIISSNVNQEHGIEDEEANGNTTKKNNYTIF